MNMVLHRGSDWNPDWAVPPGEVLAEHIEANGWSQADFARLADLSPKLVSTILSGRNPITAETAIKLERVLGLKAYVWTGLQARWDVENARQNEQAGFDASAWLARFPVSELRARDALPDTRQAGPLVEGLLTLFGIGSPDAFSAKMAAVGAHHRQSRAYRSSSEHVFTWLTLGEARARRMDLPAFDRARFLHAVAEIRSLTSSSPEIFEPRMKALCREAGVALIFEKPLSKTCLYGSARWFDTDRAIIQMSLRMKTNDHFWWTFFHEAGHIALHQGRNFLDDKAGEGDGLESEADSWAEKMLFGEGVASAIVASSPRSEAEVRAVADEIGIHPGIVVGMLQHHKKLPYTHLNGLKARFEWA